HLTTDNLVNTGRSPAIKPVVFRDYRLIKEGDKVEHFIYTGSSDVHGGFPIGSGAIVSASPIILFVDNMEKFQRRELRLITYIRVEYGIVGSTLRYFTEITSEVYWHGTKVDPNTNHITPNVGLGAIGQQNGVGIVR
ncbi:hypothetical protein, partial [Methylobacterium dankookense]|uniref:hypothetical protein n=1 Tax=Methylobacterium dankookense TaxID=560405 RepID=UPI001EDEFDB0